MVKVKIKCNKDSFKVSINGHADFNPGNDIVCSSVSGIAYAFLGAVQSYYDRDRTCMEYAQHLDSGSVLSLGSNIMPYIQSEIKAIIEMLYIGLKQIEISYPDNVNVEFLRVYK